MRKKYKTIYNDRQPDPQNHHIKLILRKGNGLKGYKVLAAFMCFT